MAKKNNKPKFSFWKKIFSWKKASHTSTEDENPIIQPEGFLVELEKARRKYQNFHIVQSMEIGSEKIKKDYKIKKIGPDLFRLDGKDFSILLVTGNSIYSKDGKISGVLQISNTDISRALQREHSHLDSFLDLWNPVLPKEGRDWTVILNWSTFWKEQILLRLRPDTIAILIVSLSDQFKDFFLKYATTKQKKIIHDEIFYLNQGKNDGDWSPHTKNKSLLNPEIALEELYEAIHTNESKIEKEKESKL